MSIWKEFKVGNIAKIENGFAFKSKDFSIEGVPIIKIKNVKPSLVNTNDLSYVPFEIASKLNKYKINKGDILITMSGNRIDGSPDSWVGKVATFHLEGTYLLNQRVSKVIVSSDDINPIYLSYVLSSIEYQQYFINEANSSGGQANISPETVRNTTFNAPDLPTQTAIAEILSSLDDKIELNNKINQELENLAQTLFKQWFIDFEFPNENGEPYKSSGGEMVESELGEIPKGWDKIKLKKLVTKSHTGADAITRAPIVDYDTGIKCARVGDMTNNRSYHNWAFCKINPEDYLRQKLGIGDIIVTRTATLGINQIIRENIDAVCNNGLIRLKIDKSICDPMFVYVQFQGNLFKEWINRISGDSSTRPNMQMDYLLDFNVIIPEKELMNFFTDSIKTYYDLIDENNRSNEELIKTRDTLLPKLISGELEINEINN